MSEKNKKMRKTILSIIVVLTLVITSFTGLLLFENNTAQAASASYNYYKVLTIESDYINASLTNFPILVNDDTGDLLGKVLTNGSDIAFYDSTNTTQFNHEIDEYDSVTGELIAWVNVTSYSHTVDTVFHMFYGDADGGYTIGYNPTEVWDSNFTAVYHMNESTTQTGGCYDSTAGANHGTFEGNMPTNVAGLVGGAQYGADGADIITLPSGALVPLDFSIECWYKSVAAGDNAQRLWFQNNGGGELNYIAASGTDKYEFTSSIDSSPVIEINYGTRDLFWTNWGARAMETNNASLFINGSWMDSDMSYTLQTVGYSSITLGSAAHALYGSIDEVRISNIARTGNWLIASYHTSVQTVGFLTYGAELEAEGGTSTVLVLNNNLFTFQGEQGTTQHANSSGTEYETGEFNITYNGQTVDYIRINFTGDLHENITNSNISIQFNYQNSSWNDTWNTLSDGANTVWLNQTEYNTNDWCVGATNPFPISTNTSVWMRTKITIPSGIGNETYTNSSFITWDTGYYN